MFNSRSFYNLPSCATITTIQFWNISITPVSSLTPFNLCSHPHHWATTTALSVSIDLPIPDTSHRWNPLVVVLLGLVSVIWHNTLRFAYFVICKLFHSFLLLNTIPRDDFIYPFIIWWPCELFPLWGCYE